MNFSKQCTRQDSFQASFLELLIADGCVYFLSPFPFLKLPPELGNKIYKFVAPYRPLYGDTEIEVKTTCASTFRGSKTRRRHYSTREPNAHSILQPGIFRSCSQIRREGLLFYFRQHSFSFALCSKSHCLPSIVTWLDDIGEFGRSNISTLSVSFDIDLIGKAFLHIKIINSRLSTKARATYVTVCNIRKMWELGKQFLRAGDPRILVLTRVDS